MGVKTFFVVFAFLVLLAVFGGVAERLYSFTERGASLAAVFTNDSVIVEVGDLPPDGPPPAEGEVSGGGDSSSSADDNNNSDTSNGTSPSDDDSVIVFDETSDDDSDDSSTPPVVDDVEVVVDNSSSGSNSSGDNEPSGTSTDSTTETIDSEEVLTALVGNQAVTTGGASGAGTGGVLSIKIHADRVREAFNARNIAVLTLPSIEGAVRQARQQGTGLTRNDFALFASAAVLQDDNVRDVAYDAGVLTTEYRALGRLFGVIPTWYTLRISITVSETGASDVSVRFPWYKFFLATGVSRSTLEQELSNQVTARVQTGAGEFDVATQVFAAMAEVLRLRVGV